MSVGAHERAQPAEDEIGVSVEDLAQIVLDGMREVPIERERLELLQAGLPSLMQREYSAEGVIAGQTAARLGYLARAAEFALFDGELEVDDDLERMLGDELDAAAADGTSSWDALARLAAEVTLTEGLDPPPGEGGPWLTLPGLGAGFRTRLRNHLTARLRRPADVSLDDLRLTWTYGYFLRILDELCDDE